MTDAPYTCVIAEDDVHISKTLIMFANKMNLHILGTMKSGTALLEAVYKEVPDIIITDIKLDRMDGLSACQRIIEEGFRSRIIIVSGSVDPTHLLTGIKLGTMDYIQKPFTFADFEKAVRKAIKNIDDMRLLEEIKSREKKFIVVKHKYRDITIDENQIIYVEKLEKRRFEIYMMNATSLTTSTNLNQINEQCSDVIFFPHKSFLVNFDHIKNIIPNYDVEGNYDITFSDTDKTVPLTRRHYGLYLNLKNKLSRKEA